MSLFIGNVSKKVTQRQFQEAFKPFGKCKIDLRRYAFIQYENERCAEAARSQLQNTKLCGFNLNIEWSKNSGRFNQNNSHMMAESRRRRSRSKDRWRKDQRWYKRSPSFDRRSSPTYSANERIDLDNYQLICPRDAKIVQKLKENRKQHKTSEAKESLSQGEQRD